MRRGSAILILFVSMLGGCSGSQAQEPQAASTDVAERSAVPAPAVPSQATAAEWSAEPRAPWAIALLSDATERPAKRSGKVVVVQADPAPEVDSDVDARDASVQFAFDADPTSPPPIDENAPAQKNCRGVVNRRS